MSNDWGPWVEHDGKGCPCAGKYVQSESRGGIVREHIAHGLTERWGPGFVLDCWDWSDPLWKIADTREQVIRYRIRKPRALLDLIEMVESLPAPTLPKVPA